jgi:hypothetical protein
VSIVDTLNAGWTQLLDLLSKIILPDWTSVINLLPILIVLGVVGPLLTILMVFWFWYFIVKPRGPTPRAVDEGPRQAPIGKDGYPVFPAGEPYCFQHGLIYPVGTRRCDVDGELLLVRCPRCGLGRPAEIDTCGNCGLVLKVEKVPRGMELGGAAGPPPGGAAAA